MSIRAAPEWLFGLDIDITFPRLHPGKTGKTALVPA
jgi:hypothetical protein